ncbi:MAG: MFS transporter [Acidimicrobiales bacterium]
MSRQSNPQPDLPTSTAPVLTKRLTYILALACGAIVANLYYAQPLLTTIARGLHSTADTTSIVVAVTQVAYAVGLFAVVPLGDILDRRKMIAGVLCITTVGLLLTGIAPTLALFLLASALVGASAVVAQVMIPFASVLAKPQERGKVVGIVMSGLLIGILVARTVSGLVAQALGWRSVYLLGAAITLALALVLMRELPKLPPSRSLRYPELLGSVVELFRKEPILRRRSLYGLLSFGIFSTFWATAALLLSKPPYSYNNATIGLFGLVGAGGALAASLAGRLADRGRQRSSTGVSIVLTIAGFALILAEAKTLYPLIIGIVLIDMGVQGVHISNQSVIYQLNPSLRSRITSVYMTSYFVGGAAASAGSTYAYAQFGWTGVGSLGLGLAIVLLIVWSTEHLGRSTTSGRSALEPQDPIPAPGRPTTPTA